MELASIIAAAGNFFHNYTILAIVIILGILIGLFRNPKEFFKLTVMLAIFGVVLYCLTLLTGTLSTGKSQKNRMIHATREAAGE